MNKLYDHDFFAWTQDQADALKRRSANELDWENLLEEIEDLGRSERRELRSRLIVLLTHILKWELQPEMRSRSWMATIRIQQRELQDLLGESPSLTTALDRIWTKAYEDAQEVAAIETALPVDDIKKAPRLSFEALLVYQVDPPSG
ncbi:MAG TPA: DUF29 domain-containing protein [Caulobacteraceae bacterium]